MDQAIVLISHLGDPYLLCGQQAHHNMAIAAPLNPASYKLSGVNWAPGTLTAVSFDGNFHKIKNLTINGTGAGLFSTASGQIKNLGLENVSITSTVASGASVGALAGTLMVSSFVSGVYATGAISIPGSGSVGGLVGTVDGGISGGAPVFNDCYSQVVITANGGGVFAGGIAGLAFGVLQQGNPPSVDEVAFSDCYSSGAISSTGGGSTGGILGTATSISVSGTTLQEVVVQMTSDFWDTATTGQGRAASATLFTGSTDAGLTDAQMKQQASFTAWDFTNVRTLSGGGYPALTGF